ncbi:MAG: HAD family phosphatase [Clostridium sp.]
MFKNIVFDMGRVLLDYDPLKVCWQYTDRAEEVELLDKALFSSPEWVLIDAGAITEEEAMKRVRDRLPNKRLKDMADQCMAHWHEYNIWPMPGMEELVRDLKEQGYHIYLCSNASLRLRVFQNEIPGMQYFDGVLVSAEEKLLKPDPAIYERLFEKFSIQPEESFFIDDLPANIEGAKKCGMDGYCFADGDVERLKRTLNDRKILTKNVTNQR